MACSGAKVFDAAPTFLGRNEAVVPHLDYCIGKFLKPHVLKKLCVRDPAFERTVVCRLASLFEERIKEKSLTA